MMSQPIRTVAVVGCGVIGMSWACLFLARNLKVIISDPAQGAEQTFEKYLSETWIPLQQGGLVGPGDTKNYEFVANIEPRLLEVDFVQENGPENLDLKQNLMQKLDEHTRSDVMIASSSSGLPSSTFIGKCGRNPGRILVGHPFNPPHLIPLVEVVPHAGTDPVVVSKTMDFYRSLGKKPILLNQEVPGFVANRLQAAINSEAYSLITRGIVTAEDLDTAVQSGPGLRWSLSGPILINALGGGGGPEGFDNRLDRLGSAIQGWEQDMMAHRFDWSDESVSKLKARARVWLESVDWQKSTTERDNLLMQLLLSKTPS